jgi:inner membrane protein involved in colicin E2 resistance
VTAKRIAAVVCIYACTVAAWVVLGKTVDLRTASQDEKLRDDVGHLWGTRQTQTAPSVHYTTVEEKVVERYRDGRETTETVEVPVRHALPLDASDVTVDLRLDHRKRGLLWYSTYAVDFAAKYSVANFTDEPRKMRLDLPLPVGDAMYDDFRFAVGGERRERIAGAQGVLSAEVELAPGAAEEVEVAYRTQGLDEWRYAFGEVNQVRNFELVMTTDFEKIDFPVSSSSPTRKDRTEAGWELKWRYANLLSGTMIGMLMPHKLNPGPWVSRVCYTAPVSLFLFLFLMLMFTTVKKINVHPVNYFFVSTAFFSFHLLLAYLVDHLNVHASFLIASAVSIFLVVSYMRLVVGRRFAFLEIGASQFVYLVLFSYTFFLQGFSGLAATILCIATLFIVMQLTGRMDWGELLGTSNTKRTGTEGGALKKEPGYA